MLPWFESHPLRQLPHLRFGRRRFGSSSGFARLARARRPRHESHPLRTTPSPSVLSVRVASGFARLASLIATRHESQRSSAHLSRLRFGLVGSGGVVLELRRRRRKLVPLLAETERQPELRHERVRHARRLLPILPRTTRQSRSRASPCIRRSRPRDGCVSASRCRSASVRRYPATRRILRRIHPAKAPVHRVIAALGAHRHCCLRGSC